MIRHMDMVTSDLKLLLPTFLKIVNSKKIHWTHLIAMVSQATESMQ